MPRVRLYDVKFYLPEIHFFKNCDAHFICKKVHFCKRSGTYALPSKTPRAKKEAIFEVLLSEDFMESFRCLMHVYVVFVSCIEYRKSV